MSEVMRFEDLSVGDVYRSFYNGREFEVHYIEKHLGFLGITWLDNNRTFYYTMYDLNDLCGEFNEIKTMSNKIKMLCEELC